MPSPLKIAKKIMNARLVRSVSTVIAGSAMRLLRRWQIAVSAAGDLWIEPIGPPLRLVELGELFRQLRPHCQDGFPKRLMFRLADFPVVGATSETVQRAVMQFATGLSIECHVR